MAPGEQIARDALAAWEKSAGQVAEQMVRDPRVLELGTSMLRVSLEWKRSVDQMIAASIPGFSR